MKAILIDPFDETVTEVEHNGDYRQIYTLLSHPEHPVSCFTVVQIENNDAIFVDDEGLLKDPKYFFSYEGYPQPLAGKGLILGTNDEGDSVDVVTTVDDIKKRVSFRHDLRLLDFESFESTMDHPLMGKNTPVFGSRPIFIRVEDDQDYDDQGNLKPGVDHNKQ